MKAYVFHGTDAQIVVIAHDENQARVLLAYAGLNVGHDPRGPWYLDNTVDIDHPRIVAEFAA